MNEASNRLGLFARSCKALLLGAQSACPSVSYGEHDRTDHWKNNLMPSLREQSDIENDLRSGAGKELEGKFRSAYSSSALVVNTFGPWRTKPDSPKLFGRGGFSSLKFEAVCPVWKNRKYITHPHLDVLIEGDNVLAIESKCTEWMKPKTAELADSYDDLKPPPDDRKSPFAPWFDEMERLREKPRSYQYLDAAQLIKHAFGLLRHFEMREILLIYLFWEPSNQESWPECSEHRKEVDSLANKVAPSCVKLFPLAYRHLWREAGPFAPEHLAYLRTRYDLEVPNPN